MTLRSFEMQSKALKHLTVTLSDPETASLDSINRLVDLCPAFPVHLRQSLVPQFEHLSTSIQTAFCDLSKSKRGKLKRNLSDFDTIDSSAFENKDPRSSYTDFGQGSLTPRSLQVVLALCDILYRLKGTFYPETLPKLLFFYVSLMYSKKNTQNASETAVYTDFSQQFTQKLISIASVSPITQSLVSSALLQSFSASELFLSPKPRQIGHKSALWPYILLGILKGLATAPISIDTDTLTALKPFLLRLLHVKAKQFEPTPAATSRSFQQQFSTAVKGVLTSFCIAKAQFSSAETIVLFNSGLEVLRQAAISARKFLNTPVPMDSLMSVRTSIALCITFGSLLSASDTDQLQKRLLNVLKQTFKALKSEASALPPEKPEKTPFSDSHLLLSKEALEGLANVSQSFPDSISHISSSLFDLLFDQEFLSSPKSTPQVDWIRNELSQSLAVVLKHEIDTHQKPFVSTCTRKLIESLEQSLQPSPIDALSPRDDRQVILLLGRIASTSKVTEQVLPLLIRTFKSNAKLLHVAVWNLAEIALSNDLNTFSLVLSLFTETYRRPFEESNRYNVIEIRNVLQKLSRQLETRDIEFRHEFVRNMLKLFQNLGSVIQKELSRSGTFQFMSVVGIVGFLLPSLAESLPCEETDDFVSRFVCEDALSIGFQAFSNDKSNVTYFRNLWFMLVLYKFVGDESKQLFEEWSHAVSIIAQFSPPLIIKRTQSYFGEELDTLPLLRSPHSEAPIRAVVARTLPELAQSNGMSFPRVVYVLTVFYLEMERVQRTASFCAMFEYLSDHNLEQSGVLSAVAVVADKVFHRYLSTVQSEAFQQLDISGKRNKRVNIINHVVFLLVRMCDRMAVVRSKAKSYLMYLTESFPFVQWNRLALGVLLDILQFVEVERTLLDAMPDEKTRNTAIQLKLPLSNGSSVQTVSLSLPEVLSDRRTVFKDISRLASTWLDTACFQVPTEILSVLQEYLQNECTNPFHSTIGLPFRLSLRTLSSDLQSSVLLRSGPVFAVSMGQRQRLLGEIQGMYECSLFTNGFGNAVERRLVTEIESLLSQPSKETQLIKALQQTAALIVWSNERAQNVPHSDRIIEEQDLLFLLCMAPAVVFTPAVVNAAVFAWRWLFSLSPFLADSLFLHMKFAWQRTVDAGIGMFSNKSSQVLRDSDIDCLFTRKHVTETNAQRNAFAAHEIWVNFITECLDPILTGDYRACLKSIVCILNASFSIPEKGSTLPSAFVPQFQLVTVAVKVLHTHSVHFEAEELLRDRVYAFSFHWFYQDPRWFHCTDTNRLRELSKLLLSLCKLLQKEQSIHESTDTLYAMSETRSVKPPSTPRRYKSGLKSFETSASDFSWIQSWKSIPQLTLTSDILEKYNLGDTVHCKSIKTPQNSSKLQLHSAKSTVSAYSSPHTKPRDLLLLFLSHELHRVTAWHNPRRDKRKLLPDQSQVSDICTTVNEHHFKSFFHCAWAVDAKLAYRLVQRFPSSPTLSDLLTAKLLDSPWALYEIGDAAVYLATERNVSQCVPQLSHLAYYKACSLPTALRFLKSPFSDNQIVSEFTMRSLASHDANSVIFYLSQVIQALRYDSFGLLKAFLLRACKVSVHLAHQLIWACQTESVIDPLVVTVSGRIAGDDPLPLICAELERQIIDQFDAEEMAFYSEEFKFFSSVTELSKDLLDIPKTDKVKRNEALRQRLAEIAVTVDGLYIPTDHSAVVKCIQAEKGVTLQSSARVPFLCVFTVEKRLSNTETLQLSQSVIFKAGDDVRQDALALQVLRLMKEIMDASGLQLYLLPYKVVPNRTGSEKDLGGVIECIPNAKSRDEMGKQNNRSLKEEFLARYGSESSSAFKRAQRNFVLSLAGYAVASYILQVKDRHNGNIMIDSEGHLVHIDFGFIFSSSPGGDLRFERSGFKYTAEMAEVMGGPTSELAQWFADLCVQGYLSVRDHAEDFYNLAALMMESPLGCFKPSSMTELRQRFALEKTEREAASHMLGIVGGAYNHVTTGLYDQFQWHKEGVWYFGGSSE